MKGIFITGTGTDIGKTFVTALLVKKLRECGVKAGYYKAALSGAENLKGRLIPGDAEYVCKVAGLDKSPESLVSFIYEEAVSPHLAALREGNPVTMNKIIRDFENLRDEFDLVTVEGSGGIVCPLRRDDKNIMITDVIQGLNLDVIIVAAASLGTINSTVLTVEYAKNHGINVKGIILNKFESGNFIHEDNKIQIEKITGIPVIACVGNGSTELKINEENLISLYKEI